MVKKVHVWPLLIFLGKTSAIHIELCSGLPPGKVHELAFLWFGLPGALVSPDCHVGPFAFLCLSLPS